MQAIIRNIQYHPNADSVAVLIEHRLGSFYKNLKQSDLPETWTDVDVLAATQAALDADPQFGDLGFVAMFPEKQLMAAEPSVPAIAPPAPVQP